VAPTAARFGAVAATYERARPTYPDTVLAALADRAGVGPGARVLDLAAGTGKLTRQLAALGADVVAVEPSAGMRAACAAAVPGVPALDGTAEAIPAEDGAVDVVTVAQAFHWFRTGPALDEIARVLRPGGWLAVVRHDPPTTAWARELWERRHRLAEFDGSAYPGRGWAAVLASDARFAAAETTAVVVRRETTVADELAEAESRSFVHTLDPDRLRVVLADLADFLATHPDTGGRPRLAYERPCTLDLCRRLP
jgi:ubiquinone/menaquinone biosynthesis C-methylase UbiE